MGIGVSLDRLAGAVAAKGGMGTISTAACGFQEPDFYRNTQEANLRALARQVKRAKELARGAGHGGYQRHGRHYPVRGQCPHRPEGWG